MSSVPLLTVAMPVFNAGKYLKLAVLSVVAQTFRDWELIIIDDGSTDNAVQEIEALGDARIKIIRDGKNKGLAARLNEVVDMARGRYLARMDQDDASYPERFARQLELLERDHTLDVISVRAIRISDNDEMTGVTPCPDTHDLISARPWQGFCFPHPTWMGRIEWFRKHRYAQPGPYFCEDQELLLRSYGQSRFASVDRILFAYRVREASNLGRVLKTRWTFLKLQMRHFIGGNQMHYVFLASLVYVGLIARDIWWSIKQMLHLQRQTQAVVDETVKMEWQKIYGEILRNY